MMASDGCKQNIAVRANMWQQRADKQYEKPPVLAFSGRHYQHLGHHEVLTLDMCIITVKIIIIVIITVTVVLTYNNFVVLVHYARGTCHRTFSCLNFANYSCMVIWILAA